MRAARLLPGSCPRFSQGNCRIAPNSLVASLVVCWRLVVVGIEGGRGGSKWWCEMTRERLRGDCVRLVSLGMGSPGNGDGVRRLGGGARRLAELEGDGGALGVGWSDEAKHRDLGGIQKGYESIGQVKQVCQEEEEEETVSKSMPWKHRAFMENQLLAFKESNPQLEVVTELIRGQHPHLKGFYRNRNERTICVKNLTPKDILLHATRLRNMLGRKVVKLKTRHLTKNPSVKSTWTTALKF
ncbi:hypothetical protein Droror1_Dr00015589 [Drosera rotundifolia]